MRQKFAREISDSKGISVITAVIVLLGLAVLGFGVAGIVSIGGRGSAAVLQSQQAFQIADSGREFGAWAAVNDPEFLAGLEGDEEFRLGRGSFTLNADTFTALETVYHYNAGDEKTAWTEGYSTGSGEQHKFEDNLYLSAETDGAERTYATAAAVDLSNVESIHIDWQETGSPPGHIESYFVAARSRGGDHSQYDAGVKIDGNFARTSHSVDVSGLTGDYYIRIHTRHTHPAQHNSELRVFRVWRLSWETRVSRVESSGYVPGRENYRAKRVVSADFAHNGALPFDVFGSESLFSDSTLYVQGSSQVHGYDWQTGQFTTDYAVASNMDINTGPSVNCYITADTQTEFAGRELAPVQIPSSLENMPFTSTGDPGISGNYSIDGAGNFYMGNWHYRPDSTLHSGSYKFNNFDLISNVELFIDGDVTIYAGGRFRMPGTANITLLEDSSLTIYMGPESGEFSVQGNSGINRGGDPSGVVIASASDELVDLFGNVRVNAVIYAPEAPLKIQGSSELWGLAAAEGVELIGNSRMYCTQGAYSGETDVPRMSLWREVMR